MAENIYGEESIFLAALQKATPEERQEYVEGACGGSPELRRRVSELLKSHDESQGPFDVPLPAVARTLGALRPDVEIRLVRKRVARREAQVHPRP